MASRTGPQNLLFDLDGTLTDSQPGIERCLRHALQACGAEAPDSAALAATIGMPLQEALGTLLGPGRAERVPEALRRYREEYNASGLFENRVYDGIVECLEALAPHATLFVATSKPRESAERILAHFGLRDYFRGVHGSPASGPNGGKGAIIGEVLSEHGVHPATAVMIGDREHDVLGARAHGITALGVAWGFGSRAELEAAGAQAILASPAELPPWFHASFDGSAP